MTLANTKRLMAQMPMEVEDEEAADHIEKLIDKGIKRAQNLARTTVILNKHQAFLYKLKPREMQFYCDTSALDLSGAGSIVNLMRCFKKTKKAIQN